MVIHKANQRDTHKVELAVHMEQNSKKSAQLVLAFDGNSIEQIFCDNGILGQVLINHHLQLVGLGINIADVDPPVLAKQYYIAILARLDAHIVLVGLVVGDKGLDDKAIQLSRDGPLDGNLLAHPLHDPLLDLIVGQIDTNQARLASSLDELVGLNDQGGGEEPGFVRGEGIDVCCA